MASADLEPNLPHESGSNVQSRPVRWPLVALCAFVGCALVFVAFRGEASRHWTGVLPALLVNVGTAFGLVGFLFVLERQFARRSVEETRRIAVEIEDRFEERARAIETRIDELQSLTDSRTREISTYQDDVIRRLARGVSFDTVTKALAVANGLEALASDRAKVAASSSPDGLSLVFSWGTDRTRTPSKPSLILSVEGIKPRRSESWTSVVEVEWKLDASAPEVGARLVSELQRRGAWDGPETFEWEKAIANLNETIDVAVSSRRRDAGAWHLSGSLYELVEGDWAITEAGIEHRVHGLVVNESDFPERPGRGAFRQSDEGTVTRDEHENWRPDQPSYVKAALWGVLVKRSKAIFPLIRSLAMLQFAESTWVPCRDHGDGPDPEGVAPGVDI